MTDLNARYGKNPSKSRRNVIVLASVLLAAFLVWAIAVNFFTPTSHKDFAGEAVKYKVTQTFLVTAEIRMDGFGAHGIINCTAKALDSDYNLVGYKEFGTAFDGDQEKRFDLSINTTSQASSVVIEACKLK